MENKWEETPGITVITPTHGRVDLVAQLLISLQAARQAYSGPTEVLIVDSSPAHESEKIQRACSEYDAICHCMPNNVRQKRNWGIRNAKYPIILFMNSDCIADVHLLVEHGRFYANNTIPDLGGVVGLTRFVGKENWVWQIIRRSSTLDAFSYPERHQVVPWGPTCNISYWRNVLEKVGLFDTTFPFVLGGDDTDLGLRVTNSGYRIMTSAHAIVEHEKRTWTRIYDIAQRRYRWGRMHYYLMRKHSHRVSTDPPTTLGIFLTMLILFVPTALVSSFAAWTVLPFLWFALEIILEAILISRGQGHQPGEFLYTIGTCVLTILYQVGSVVEGLKNHSLAPLYKDANYCPPSKDGRRRGIAQMWAKVIALPLSVWLILLFQILSRTS